MSAEDPTRNDFADGLTTLQAEFDKRFNVMTGALDVLQKNIVNEQQFTSVTTAIEERFDTLKKEVDGLQIQVMQPAKPWFRQPSLIVSVAAVLFSMGTFMLSYNQTRAQDRRAARAELRQLIQRMIALPRENMELAKTYEKDPVTSNLLSGLVNQEQSVLARQAAEILERISNDASAREYHAVAQALADSNNMEMAPPLIEKGLSLAKDYSTELELLRLHGNILITLGDSENGRAKYQEASNLANKYHLTNQSYVATSNAITEMNWAISEFGQGQCQEARRHISQAKENLGRSLGPLIDRLKQQVVSYEDFFQKNPQNCRN